jgi:RNA polymerase sigma factor (sigma-70 family)
MKTGRCDMDQNEALAQTFEAHRQHLRGVAYRILGSLSEADDAVQQAWLRVSRSGMSGVDNVRGWLTTVVARLCVDMLRARESRREEQELPERVTQTSPEDETLLADSVGLAMLVVLERLAPLERLVFVLHDVFAVPFEEIAAIVERSPEATRQIASRARRRVRGVPAVSDEGLRRQREVVDAFLAAARNGDFEGLLALLDPEIEIRADAAAGRMGRIDEIRGPADLARKVVQTGARAGRAALVDGQMGIVVAPRGRLMLVFRFTIENGRITVFEATADRERLERLELAVPE